MYFLYIYFNILKIYTIPSFFDQLTIVPLSMVGDKAGKVTLTWLGNSVA